MLLGILGSIWERVDRKLATKKDVLFIIGDWNAKVGSQETPGVTANLAFEYRMKQGKGSQSFAKRTHWSWQTPSSNNTREHSTHGHHQMLNTKIRLIIFFAAKDGLGADCGSDHELLIAKFGLKLKKVGKTTRPFRYDQIIYDYTVEVRNRFKGLDLIDRMPDELWKEVCDTVEETGIKTIPKKKKCKKA